MLYLDCFSGASGDMVLGALLDLGLPLDALKGALGSLAVDYADVTADRVSRAGVSATKFRLHEQDTGSPPVQIALLTERINQLASHFQTHKKDFNSRQGLLKMISRRRSLLEYLKGHDEDAYRGLLDALKLRK